MSLNTQQEIFEQWLALVSYHPAPPNPQPPQNWSSGMVGVLAGPSEEPMDVMSSQPEDATSGVRTMMFGSPDDPSGFCIQGIELSLPPELPSNNSESSTDSHSAENDDAPHDINVCQGDEGRTVPQGEELELLMLEVAEWFEVTDHAISHQGRD